MKRHQLSGFTLIELLVVIAIIAILAAILFPVFARAKAAAKQTACLSNTKQLGVAMQLYLNDYDDTYPWIRKTTYSGGLPSSLEVMPPGMGLNPYVKSDKVFIDPGNGSPYWSNDLLGGVSATTLENPSNVGTFVCPASGEVSDFPWILLSCLIGPIACTIDLVLLPANAAGNLDLVTASNSVAGGTSTYSWQIFQEPVTTTLDPSGNPLYTYGAGTNYPAGNVSRTGTIDPLEMTASIADQLANGVAPGAVAPVDNKQYWQLHPQTTNFAFADGHSKAMQYQRMFSESSQDGPSWDPGIADEAP